MTTTETMNLTRVRNDLCQKWREYLLDSYAVEVTTPIMHRQPDIAPVHQFTTTHPSTSEQTYLRIAPTEYLKRLLAAGEERVFEFSTNFRDDVPDETHLPEFTSLEFMARDRTCTHMEKVAIDLCALAVEVALRALAPAAQPRWVRQWEEHGVRRIELADELSQRFGVSSVWVEEPTTIVGLLRDLGKPVAAATPLPALLDLLVTAIAEHYSGAVLICGFPEHLGGPAAPHPSRLGFKQRSELFIDGLEVANMSSNLTDIRALWQWHQKGVQIKTDLDIATNHLDDELLTQLDGNLPPSAVLGIGVERTLQAALNLSDIRTLR